MVEAPGKSRQIVTGKLCHTLGGPLRLVEPKNSLIGYSSATAAACGIVRPMHRTYRLPAMLLAGVAIAAAIVIGLRLGADGDPAPPDDTSPVVILPSTPPVPAPAPTASPTPLPGTDDEPGDDDDDDDDFFDRTVPAPRDYDDDDDEPDDDRDEPDDPDDD
jgi:hypothetical protein